MLLAGQRTATARAERTRGERNERISRVLGWALLGLVAFLLVEVLFEAWVQVRLADRGGIDADGNRIVTLAQWPKTLKNAVYLVLLGLTASKIALDRRWRDFLTRADLALGALAVALVIAGFAGRSSPRLIGEAAYVYLRGAIVFYAWRAADPSWRRVRVVLFGVGGVVGANALIAIAQTIVGYNSYRALGWVNLSWARLNRAHALLDHPNHLGHVLALTLLGLLAYFVTRPAKAAAGAPSQGGEPSRGPVREQRREQRRGPGWGRGRGPGRGLSVGWRLWGTFAVLAVAMSSTQSRESLIGFIAGAGVIVFLRRGGWPVARVAGVALVLVVGFAAAQVAYSPSNRAELQRRLAGVFNALQVRSGQESTHYCVKGSPDCSSGGVTEVPQREVRVLYAQQGADLWLKRPLLGYGVGQFGGIVATEHDPRWWADPRFGLHGFNMYGFNAQQVDSFWLHLLVETGAVGSLAYLSWLALLIAPFVALSVRRRRGLAARAPRAPPGAGAANRPLHPAAYWAPAAMALGIMIAFFSSSLEDPIFPAMLFTVLGVAWMLLRRGALATPQPAGGPDRGAASTAPAHRDDKPAGPHDQPAGPQGEPTDPQGEPTDPDGEPTDPHDKRTDRD